MNELSPTVDEVRLVTTGSGGLVARRPGVVLVVPSVVPASSAPAERLLALCLDEPGVDGGVLLRRVAYLLTDPDALATPGFGLLVSRGGEGHTLLAYGAVEVELPDGERLSTTRLATWAERRLEAVLGLRVMAPGSSSQQGNPRSARLDLREGVVDASEARLVPSAGDERRPVPPVPVEEPLVGATGPAAPAPQGAAQPSEGSGPAQGDHPAAAADPPAALPSSERPTMPHVVLGASRPSFDAVLLTSPQEPEVRAPLPVADDPGREDDRVFVEGVVCSRGHFNDPGAAYCSVCGISMVQRTHEYVSAPRPPLGVLIFDDGAAFSVDGDYVLGREPELDESVAAGAVRPLALDDADSTVSRVHAGLHLEGWKVLVEDRGSANGTFLGQLNGDEDWQRLDPGRAVELAPGQRVRFGRRVAVFESHVRQR